jgi:hypothetical protein
VLAPAAPPGAPPFPPRLLLLRHQQPPRRRHRYRDVVAGRRTLHTSLPYVVDTGSEDAGLSVHHAAPPIINARHGFGSKGTAAAAVRLALNASPHPGRDEAVGCCNWLCTCPVATATALAGWLQWLRGAAGSRESRPPIVIAELMHQQAGLHHLMTSSR